MDIGKLISIFEDIRSLLLKIYTVREDYIAKPIQEFLERNKNKTTIGVHVRRGDYVFNGVTNKVHGVLSLQYYYEAMNYLNDKFEQPVFFLFSDDLDWCCKNMNHSNFNLQFIDFTNHAIEDFYLLQHCKHNIIANSSFSWWTAYLNQNPNKIIISPKKWLNGEAKNMADLIPNNWLRI